MDDQTVMCDPRLVNHVIDAVGAMCEDPNRGRVRNRLKTHVIIYATLEQVQEHQYEWNLDMLNGKATLTEPIDDLKPSEPR